MLCVWTAFTVSVTVGGDGVRVPPIFYLGLHHWKISQYFTFVLSFCTATVKIDKNDGFRFNNASKSWRPGYP